VSSDIVNGRASSGRLGSRYELHERIETSTTSSSRLTSWRAYDTTLRRQVRLDVHRPGGSEARRFLDTAYAAGAVTHPALARVLDVVDEGDQAYIVSAWIDGTSLTTLLGESALDPDQATSLIGQLADGLVAAHRIGATVGVLRPDHLLITPGGAVTLARVTRPGPTPTDDVRGLGALLYAALTGRWPLDTGGAGLPPAPTASGRLCTPRQLRAGIPADLSTLTMRTLYPDHPGGISSAAAFADALSARSGPPQSDLLPFRTSEPAPEEAPEPREPRRKSPFRIAAPVAGALVIGLVAWLIVSVAAGNKHPGGRPAAAAPSPHSASQSSGGATQPSRPPTHTQAALQATKVNSALSFNPFGQPPGDDNAAKVGLASDGNPQTSWLTDPYMRSAKFGNLKPGTGIAFDLGSPVAIRQIRISTPTPGISLQVLGGDSASQQPSAMTVVGSKSQVGTSLTVSTTSKTPHRFWVVWLTQLVPTSSGQFQGGISEVRFLH
jgi:serine/threonine protein kinase